METNLDKLRDKINLIDKELVELIEQRMEIVTSIAEYKRKTIWRSMTQIEKKWL